MDWDKVYAAQLFEYEDYTNAKENKMSKQKLSERLETRVANNFPYDFDCRVTDEDISAIRDLEARLEKAEAELARKYTLEQAEEWNANNERAARIEELEWVCKQLDSHCMCLVEEWPAVYERIEQLKKEEK